MDKPIPEAVRKQFETWARTKWRHREDFDQRIGAPHGTYNNIEVQAAWEAWQALTAAQQQGEAVAWQERYLDIDTGEWSQWRYCAKYIYEAHLNFRVPEIEARALYTALPSAPAGVEGPLSVFSAGEWRYSETGQTFSAKDLDEAAFVVYRDHLAQQPAAVDSAKHWHDLYRKECLLRQDDAARYGQQIADLEALAQQPEARGLVEALVLEIERNTCMHEETYRGGAIWEICHACGAKWADDEGGRPEFKWPECVERAHEWLAALTGERNG